MLKVLWNKPVLQIVKKNGPSIWIFGSKRYTIVAFGNLKKLHSCEKSTSWVVIKNGLNKSDCIVFKF